MLSMTVMYVSVNVVVRRKDECTCNVPALLLKDQCQDHYYMEKVTLISNMYVCEEREGLGSRYLQKNDPPSTGVSISGPSCRHTLV